MDAITSLSDPVRRRMVEILSGGDRTAGELARLVGDEYGISQPAVSRHLRVLRETGIVVSSIDGQQRRYSLELQPIDELAQWLEEIRTFWTQRLDALETELARGDRRSPTTSTAAGCRTEEIS